MSTPCGGPAFPTLTRRQLLRGATLGLGAAATSGLLGACGKRARSDPLGLDRLAPPVDDSGRTLSLLTIEPHALAAKQLAHDFKVATGVQVNWTAIPYDQVQNKALGDVQSGAGRYDVFDYWYTTLGALVHQNALEDLTDFIKQTPQIRASDFITSIYDPYTLHDGRRYGLPFDGDTHVLFWNQQLLEASRVQPPTTWDEYLEVAKKVTMDGKGRYYGAVLLGQQSPIIIGSSYANRLAGFGGRFLTPDGEPALNDQAGVNAAAAMKAVQGWALPTPFKIAFDAALEAFLQGQVAMMEFWTDLGIYAEHGTPQVPTRIKGRWGVSPLPVGGANAKPVAALNAGFGMGVSRASRNKDLAKRFVAFATGAPINRELITTPGSGIDPTRRSTLNAPAYQAFAPKVQQAAKASLNGAFAWPTNPQSYELMTILADNLSDMLRDQLDPAAAIAKTQSAWKQLLGSS
jgi:multiple sugar transport system substrate-binding protein